MLFEDKLILWRASAVALGLTMPLAILGKSVLGIALFVGLLTGLLATKDESLRTTVKLLLNNTITLLVVAFLLVCTVGVALGANPLNAFSKWSQLVGVALGAGLLFMTLREMPGQQVELLLKVLAIGVMALCGLATLDALTGNLQLATALHGADKAESPYRLNFISSWLAVLLPFVWARLLLKAREGEPFAMRIALPAAAFGLFVLVLAGGRAGWVGGAAGLLVFMLLGARHHGLNIHRKHWMGVAGVVGLALAVYALSAGPEFVFNRISIVGEEGVGRGMLSGRFEVWQAALANVPQNLWYGVGVMNYRVLGGAIDLHPHNWVLQLLVETGLPGLLLFSGILGMMGFQFWRFARGNLYGVAALAALVAYAVTSLAYTSIFRWDWLALLAFIGVLGYRAGWSRPDQKQRRKTLKNA